MTSAYSLSPLVNLSRGRRRSGKLGFCTAADTGLCWKLVALRLPYLTQSPPPVRLGLGHRTGCRDASMSERHREEPVTSHPQTQAPWHREPGVCATEKEEDSIESWAARDEEHDARPCAADCLGAREASIIAGSNDPGPESAAGAVADILGSDVRLSSLPGREDARGS